MYTGSHRGTPASQLDPQIPGLWRHKVRVLYRILPVCTKPQHLEDRHLRGIARGPQVISHVGHTP